MNMQRAHAGRDIQNAVEIGRAEMLLQHMDAEAQVQIELQLAVLHQQILVSVSPENHGLRTVSDGLNDCRLGP